ncbi:hypothetical protein SGODD07_02022 [Streptococcus gordonii]|uniref:Uncharacterized protein n=1 Tax=Streptococcus gordonii TaxID=1302 RepID=A0A139MYQ7_STRGN|nr:hypothetical protein SGODD07_02022 [Streptococcus gordonii]
MNNEIETIIEIKIAGITYQIERKFVGKNTLQEILEKLILEEK